jgi:hypothetical protein
VIVIVVIVVAHHRKIIVEDHVPAIIIVDLHHKIITKVDLVHVTIAVHQLITIVEEEEEEDAVITIMVIVMDVDHGKEITIQMIEEVLPEIIIVITDLHQEEDTMIMMDITAVKPLLHVVTLLDAILMHVLLVSCLLFGY